MIFASLLSRVDENWKLAQQDNLHFSFLLKDHLRVFLIAEPRLEPGESQERKLLCDPRRDFVVTANI